MSRTSVGITLLLGGLACSGFMTPVIALAVLVVYLLVAGEVFSPPRSAACSGCRLPAPVAGQLGAESLG